MRRILFLTVTIFFFNINCVFTQSIKGEREVSRKPEDYLIVKEASYNLKNDASYENNLWFLSNQEKSVMSRGQFTIINKINTQKNKKQLDHLKTETHNKNNEIYYDPEQNGYLLFKLDRMQPR